MASAFLDEVRTATVEPGELALWYTGGAGYVVKTAGAALLLDPFTGPSNPPDWIRNIPPAFEADEIGELGKFDAVLITHEHGDHADPVSLGPIGTLTNAMVYGSPACIEVAKAAGVPDDRARVLAHGESVTFGDLKVTAVPMYDPGAPGCNGYVLQTGAVTLLQAGDGIMSPHFHDAGQQFAIDAICLSVGANPLGKNYYLDEAGAARAARDAGARILIPQHFDLWQGITLDPERVAVAARWYTPGIEVLPARFRERITLASS